MPVVAKDSDIPTAQILVVDDEVDHAQVMGEALRRLGHVCTIVHSLADAGEELDHGRFDLIVTDLVMEGEEDGLRVLDRAQQTQPDAETILVTAHGDVPTATAALRGGAYDFIEKPLDLEVFRNLATRAIQAVMLRAQNDALRGRLDEKFGFEGIIGNAPQVRQLIATMRQIAPSTIPVLVTGESGTGKELVAQAIHNNSKRAKMQFVPLNCAGLSESILEDELFGHIRGAFTGADKDRQGRFEFADGGTLFLDEVGDMPLIMQAKLLRVLESGEVVRLGDNESRHVNVRLISATNHDLGELVSQGKFREDLFFRIKGAELKLSPLRERREDIALLADHYARHYAVQGDKEIPQISEQVLQVLTQFDWPGNVRQLMYVIQTMVVVAEGNKLEPRHLPPEVREGKGELADAGLEATTGMSLEQIEKQAIRNALRVYAGNREQAAKSLGIGERTLYRKLKEYGLK
ncbi:MAG: sigma-54-dependent Fis family transcriptional regulator [Phycisphaeraceae bacterium]|nr:sigma-54-dependent Fis family transcriptional regulator [Phycisphaeraceae bacterium]